MRGSRRRVVNLTQFSRLHGIDRCHNVGQVPEKYQTFGMAVVTEYATGNSGPRVHLFHIRNALNLFRSKFNIEVT